MSTPERMRPAMQAGSHARREFTDAPVGAPLPPISGEERRQAHRSLTQTPADDTWPLVIAGLDPAVHHLRERMEWVIRAFTPVFDDLCPRMTDEERCMAV